MSRATPGSAPRQSPCRRTYPDGRVVWVARYFDLSRKARYAKPVWHGRKSTFARRVDAQRAIDEALARQHGGAGRPRRLGDFAADWLERYPRSARTNETNSTRLGYVLGVEIEGRPLGEWEFDEVRRPQVSQLVDHMLRVEGRAAGGVRGVLSVFSAMAEDAIGEDAATHNGFVGVRIRAGDPRVRKPPRKVRLWSFEQMRAFAVGGRPGVRAATRRPRDPRREGGRTAKARFYPARDYEALLLTPGLTGLRLGEFLGLAEADFDGGEFRLRHSTHDGELVASSEHKNHERRVPVPPSLARLIPASPRPVDTEWLFPTPRGRLWRERNFYRDVWVPAQRATGLDPTPHEFRHSYVTNLRAAGIDDADLAAVAGHTVATMISVYTHALHRSHAEIREVIG
ncbi:MAG TPA: tyrosine-type recombinase/integrase [Solirubrobacterales bacterium]|nr:tyrosine-type recombinase/integrase [Solirubrobacterales bacterium]